MSDAPRIPPRFVPTLTEVVQVHIGGNAPSPVTTAIDHEALVQRVLQRVDVALDRQLREAVAALVLDHTQNLIPRLRLEIEAAVRTCVSSAVSQELAGFEPISRPKL